jgi:hypothetical protein
MPARTLLALLCLWAALGGAEAPSDAPATDPAGQVSEPAPPPAGRHHFTPGDLRIYHYEALQTVTQQDLDDTLTFESLLRWRFALRCAAADSGGADLVATIILVQASHQGPGSSHSVDSSRADESGSDALLGHLLRLNGRSLQLRWSQTGGVSAVGGSQDLIEALAGSGVDADRRRRQAQQLYSEEALLRFWQAVLLQPAATEETIDLPAPLAGQARRRWQEGAWQLQGVGPIGATLATSPSPLQATLAGLKGQGRVEIDPSGILRQSHGQLDYRCDWLALGQPASQQHRLRWQCLLVDYRPAPASTELPTTP